MKSFKLICFLFALMTYLSGYSQSKKEKEAAKQDAVKVLVDARRFVFQAQSASPAKGGMRQLSLGYTLNVLPDTVICDLP